MRQQQSATKPRLDGASPPFAVSGGNENTAIRQVSLFISGLTVQLPADVTEKSVPIQIQVHMYLHVFKQREHPFRLR